MRDVPASLRASEHGAGLHRTGAIPWMGPRDRSPVARVSPEQAPASFLYPLQICWPGHLETKKPRLGGSDERAGGCLLCRPSFRSRDNVIEKRRRTLLRRAKCARLLFPADPLPVCLVSFSPTLLAAFRATLFPVPALYRFVEPSHEIDSFYNSKRSDHR